MSNILIITLEVLPLRCGTSIRIGAQIKKQASPNFDLIGKTYEAIHSILLAKRFNRAICFDEEPRKQPKGSKNIYAPWLLSFAQKYF